MRTSLIFVALFLPLIAQAQEPALGVDGTALVLRLPNGKTLRGTELEGATLHMALNGRQAVAVKLASIKPDPKDASILRHEFQVQNDKGKWQSFCDANYYGETWGIPIALPAGHPGREGEVTLTCASGAVGKCVRFGYKPWAKGPHGEDLAPYHAACVHMVRADYCGDSQPHTKDGTQIDIYDHLGMHDDAKADPEYAFEAGWAPDGAVCVAHTRWSDVATLDSLRAECPRLPLGDVCTEKAAQAKGALVFNRSRLKPRLGDR